MKTVHHAEGARDKTLHIETALGIVNIFIGLSDSDGHEVTAVEIIPDPGVTLDGYRNSRLIREVKED